MFSSPTGDRLNQVVSTRVIPYDDHDHTTREDDEHFIRRFLDELHDKFFALRAAFAHAG